MLYRTDSSEWNNSTTKTYENLHQHRNHFAFPSYNIRDRMKVRRFVGLRPLLLPVAVILGCLIAASASPTEKKLRQVFSWKSLEFAFPNQRARESAIKSGDFIPGNPVPIDVDVYSGNNITSKVFITIPRFQDGVPVTLGYVTDLKTDEGNPIIAPYPNWEWQRPSAICTGIISVYRVQVDECGRLWVSDTGKLGSRQVCPPQLLVFSLITNKLLSRHVFPRDQYTESSLFVTPVVDIRDKRGLCEDTYVYVADVTGFSLVVYDHRNKKSWNIINRLFYPYPPYGTFTINGESFDLMDGILGLALGPITPDGDRVLFFHSLASREESWVPTSIIRNSSIFEHDPEAAPRSFRPFNKERSSQAAAQAMDKNGVLFFGLMSDTAIGCWNSRDYPEFGGNNIEKLVVDRETLQFPSGMKIVTSSNGHQELWVITVSFQKVMTGSLSTSETNFRIQADYVHELTRGTKCDVVAQGINKIHRHNVNREIPVHHDYYHR